MQKVRYRGSPSSVAVLDSLLRDEGLRVDHREIVERQGVSQDIVDVVVYIDDPDVDPDANGAVGASPEALLQPRIETAIAKLRISVPRAQAQIVATHNDPPHTPEPDDEAGSAPPKTQPYAVRSATQ